MTELTPEELAAYLARSTRWNLIKNWFKNLSWLWSPRERRLQAELKTLHDGIGDIITTQGGRDILDQDFNDLETLFPDEDHRIVAEPPKMFPDQPGGWLG